MEPYEAFRCPRKGVDVTIEEDCQLCEDLELMGCAWGDEEDE